MNFVFECTLCLIPNIVYTRDINYTEQSSDAS